MFSGEQQINSYKKHGLTNIKIIRSPMFKVIKMI